MNRFGADKSSEDMFLPNYSFTVRNYYTDKEQNK